MNKSSRKPSNADSSRVLLVCIYDTVVTDISNEMLYSSFTGHGRVEKLLVFEKGQVTKAFVQFASVGDAEKAKRELDGTKLPDTFCKMHLFYSNLKEVDLSNRLFSRGKDYSSCSSDVLAHSEVMEHNVVRTKRKTSDDFDLEHTRDHFTLESFGRFSRTDQQNHMNAIQAFRMQDPEAEHHNLEDRIRWDIEKLMLEDEDDTSSKSPEKEEPEPMVQIPVQVQPIIEPTMQTIVQPIVQLTETASEDPICNWILWFSYEHKLRPMEVYNLFSNFGDINKIIVRKATVVVEFLTPQFAAIACESLNSSVFYGNVLRLVYGSSSMMKERQREYAESLTFDESFYRFTTHKSLSINQPSVTLHVSNLKREVCNCERLKELFSEAGGVDKVSILGNGREKSMALVKMASLEESFAAVGLLHGTSVQGRKLQISFTKSRI